MPKKLNPEKVFIIPLIILICSSIIWNVFFKTSDIDTDINKKQLKEEKDLEFIKNGVIGYYCKYKKFPVSLKNIVPEFSDKIPKDFWRNEYVFTSLPWRIIGSGMDLVATGKDGKIAGKGEGVDTILRIDLDKINCN